MSLLNSVQVADDESEVHSASAAYAAAAADPLGKLRSLPAADLKRMALSPPGAKTTADDSEDVPAQRMSEFLGTDAPAVVTKPTAVAASLFDHLAPASAEQQKLAAAKKKSLFAGDSDDEDEETKAKKEAQRAAARAALKAKKEAELEAAQTAMASSQPTSPISPTAAAVAAPASSLSSAAPSAASKRAGTKDLFGDDDDSTLTSKSLAGVYIPRDAAEFRTAEERLEGEAVDPELLNVPDGTDLERFTAGSSQSNVSAAASRPVAAAHVAAHQPASAASASVDEDLDDDLFSFSTPAPKAAQPSAVDASAADFSFADYLAKQRQGTSGSGVSQGASLFDDE
jgi:hypothetical protein